MPFIGILQQGASKTVLIGPFVDEDDGKTPEMELTIAQADVRLCKNGGSMAQKNESTSCTHDEVGMYACPLDTTDTDTIGILSLVVAKSGALHIRHDFVVVPKGTTVDNIAGL